MLKKLSIQNYALIDSLEVEFDGGLNIITGETGAGKSILLGALHILLGAKADVAAIKDTTRNCVIEGTFDIGGLGLERLFTTEDVDFEPQTTIRRVILPSGRTRNFVNDCPVQVALLKQIGDYTIDIHSQHENLILTSELFRTKAVDTIAGCEKELAEYQILFEELGFVRKQLQLAIEQAEKDKANEEWVRYQFQELEGAKLEEGEIEELEREIAVLDNADNIVEALNSLHETLDSEDFGTLGRLKENINSLNRIADNYPPSTEFAQRVDSVYIELKDINSSICHLMENIEADPEKLDKLTTRLVKLQDLCHKHKVESVTDLIALRDRYGERLNNITHSTEIIEAIKEQVKQSEAKTLAAAQSLHEKRVAVAPKFEKEVVTILDKVGMSGTKFCIDFGAVELCQNGIDKISFLFSANSAVAVRPIEQIASGGELSRVMLALKSILAGKLKLPTIIFDEIDTGVSGKVANAVGNIIADLAQKMQVINITHLPQVASKGNRHFFVYKKESSTFIKQLNQAERVTEIAKMLSGENISAAAIEQAKILLAN